MYFIDTTILIYALSENSAEQSKATRALEILQLTDCVLSIQVLQEFYVQSTRSSRVSPLSHDEASAFIATLRRYKIQDNTIVVFQMALRLKERYQISFWDASILAAANITGCTTVFSEDLNTNQIYDNVRVINPFVIDK